MPIHVVHVEDERPLRDILGVALRAVEPGIKLEQFISGDDALNYIQTNGKSIDLFVLDIRLPGKLNGIQVAQAIRDLQCPGHIVLTSAYSAPDQELLASLHGEYYPKPWHLFELTEKLIKYRLDSPAPSREQKSSPPLPKADVKLDTPPAAPTVPKPVETQIPSVKPDAKLDGAPVAPAKPDPKLGSSLLISLTPDPKPGSSHLH